jgi:segregation and condensation protein A
VTGAPPEGPHPPETSERAEIEQPNGEAGEEGGRKAPGSSYDPLQVTLPYFDGPLDLLLHLVRKQTLDINELRLAELTEPYLAYVERMRELNLDQAGEFLAIAATLIWIKSRSLLPRDALTEDEPDPETVEELLIQRLQAYQHYKDAAVQLLERDMLGRDVFARQAPPDPEPEGHPPPPVEEVSLFGLLEAFRSVLERSAGLSALHLIPDRARIEERIEAVLNLLQERTALEFQEFFPDGADRADVILTFIAVLELVRLKAVHLSQAAPLGPIHCRTTQDFDRAGADYKAHILRGLLDPEGEEEGADVPAPPP